MIYIYIYTLISSKDWDINGSGGASKDFKKTSLLHSKACISHLPTHSLQVSIQLIAGEGGWWSWWPLFNLSKCWELARACGPDLSSNANWAHEYNKTCTYRPTVSINSYDFYISKNEVGSLNDIGVDGVQISGLAMLLETSVCVS